MTQDLALEVSDVRAGYDSYDVLMGVSLKVGANERVGLFGPNGHGKTTLLNAISGVIKPRVGNIRFLDDEIAGKSPQAVVDRGLIHVPQANLLFPQMEVMETLELAAFCKRAKPEKSANLDKVLQLFPRLKERRRQQCKTLSGGERQMLSIGVGLMCAPKMLMLDEPTLGLSPKLKDELAVAIGEISQTGIPLLLVEQDISFVLSLADRMYLVDHGEITREVSKGQDVDHEQIMQMYFGEEHA
ncbi:ABC transporter ATP-binding protein (plasmid) [Aminobacter sp. UC22_36]|uniref:ABC transporter ATP-binding protein n=1 Tax=Aminobacter sp. UC22_36 TaxID=3374549 RepID=UPI0037583EF8